MEINVWTHSSNESHTDLELSISIHVNTLLTHFFSLNSH